MLIDIILFLQTLTGKLEKSEIRVLPTGAIFDGCLVLLAQFEFRDVFYDHSTRCIFIDVLFHLVTKVNTPKKGNPRSSNRIIGATLHVVERNRARFYSVKQRATCSHI